MSTQTEEIEGGYRFLAVVLFLLIALPLASYALLPNNSYAAIISYPARLLLLPIHEFGHLLLMYPTEFLRLSYTSMDIPITIAGSLFEMFLPFLVALLFIFGNQRYALACMVIVILGASINDTGMYVQSASNPTGMGINALMQPTLITPENHDWVRILSYFNALDKTDLLGGVLMDLGFVVMLLGFFSALFEVNLMLNYQKSSDFMLLMFYGSIPTIILSIVYYTPATLILSLLIFTPPLIHFYKRVLPTLKKEIDEVDKEIEMDEKSSDEKTTGTE